MATSNGSWWDSFTDSVGSAFDWFDNSNTLKAGTSLGNTWLSGTLANEQAKIKAKSAETAALYNAQATQGITKAVVIGGAIILLVVIIKS